jgi:hypothetical protein
MIALIYLLLKENKNENTRLGTKGRKNVGVKV